MVNKFFKIIHNRYSTFFKFLFFLRYLFAIFLFSASIFLIIPKFFDYEKKASVFKSYLFKNYNFQINKYSDIKFYIFPAPQIEIKNVEINLKSVSKKLFTNKIILYPKFFSIYNNQNFETRKIILKKSSITLESLELNKLVKNFLKQKENMSLKNLKIKVLNQNNHLIDIEKIDYTNFGYNRNLISGKIFDKNFKVKHNTNLNYFLINIPDIGFKSEIDLLDLKENYIKGKNKLKILNSNLKFDFIYRDKKFDILNTNFRNKNLSFAGKSVFSFDPYFELNSYFVIEDINSKIIKKLDFKNFLNKKDIIKKINMKNEIRFKSKKFSGNLIDDLNLKIHLAYGRLNYNNTIIIKDSVFKCKGLINLFEELPLLNFDCNLITKDKKKFLKVFSLKPQDKEKFFELNIVGNLNLFNNKINFKKITTNNYQASKLDLKYFKNQFEDIILNEGFLNIFDFKKVKNFILEVS